jgi:protoheme IX farnesyltransferase
MARAQAITTKLAAIPGPLEPSVATVSDYVALLKPRVMSLVVFTALVGLVIAPGSLHPVIGFTALLCIAVGAGASGALNMWYDADVDALMTRTAKRPIPVGRIAPAEAFAFGALLAAFSVMTMALLVNWLSAGLLAFTIIFYAAIYTVWLKRATPQNIVIGGAAGAFPPMIGWTAATGTIGLESVLLFLIIFFWTPPHFWALSLSRASDYARAGIPMLPVVSGAGETKKQIVVYSALLLPIGAAPWLFGFTSALYGAVSIFGGAAMLAFAMILLRAKRKSDAEQAARHLFAYSVLYLTVLFAVILVDHSLNWPVGRIAW